jgi:hypothetical protein
MWFWPSPERESLSGFSGAELPFVIVICLLVAAGAIVYWINEGEDSPGIHVLRFFWKLFNFLGLPALAILNWNHNSNSNLSWLLFSILLSFSAATGVIRILLGKRFANAKPTSSSIAKDINALLLFLTVLAGFNMLNDLPLNEVIYTLLIASAAIATFMNVAKARRESAKQKFAKLSELPGLTSFAAIFFALVVGLLIQFVVRRLDLDDVWQSVTFWIVLALEVGFISLMLLALAGNAEETTKKNV